MAGGHALPGLSLCLASGLSSPGRLCCLAMSLRYAALMYRWLCAHSLLDHGVHGLLPVLRPPTCSGSAKSGGFSSPLWLTTFAMGSPLQGRGLFVLDRNEGLVCFIFPFGLFLRVVPALWDKVTLWVRASHPVTTGVFPGGPR